MKIFHCNHCRQLVFFENSVCLRCEHPLAYFVDLGEVSSLESAGENLWRSPLPAAQGRVYRLCENNRTENVCNWAVAAADSNSLCASCRLTRVIPDLSQAKHKQAWYRLEVAKRRLVYSLLAFGLPLKNKIEDPKQGLAYEFLSDHVAIDSSTPVLTGHADGVITINIAEANDVERERRRLQMDEPYRTLLGHFRHEVGHYYWDRLIKESRLLDSFREVFGDERRDYAQALREYYDKGPVADWQRRFVSAYASSHPWEDWAETWAHYLHMTDALETAAACGLRLHPRGPEEPALLVAPRTGQASFQRLIESWFPLTYVLNNLNRSLGQPDGYPFVLSTPAIDKLRFVHETIHAAQND